MSSQQLEKKENNVIYLNAAIAPEKALKLLKSVKSEADSTFKHLFAGLLENISETAFEEVDRSGTNDLVQNHLNIVRSIKVNKRIFLETFFKLMNQSWLNLLHKKDEPAVVDATGDAAIEIDRLQRKIAVHYKILLSELQGRFNAIAGKELHYHPLLPNQIFQSYWNATAKLNLEESERILLLLLFNRFVMDKSGKLFGIVNSKLEELGVDPLERKPQQSDA